MTSIQSRLISSLRRSATHNSDIEVSPVCILWPDKEHQWEAVIPTLQDAIPELYILGDYNPDNRTGPAIWLRCILARSIVEALPPKGTIPILYLPGVGRSDLRAVEECPGHLKPLAELQYRGSVWSQTNGKDWTILAYLKSVQGGLGLDVSQDTETKHAMILSLSYLLEEDYDLLTGKRLDNDYFNTLLMGGDPVKDLLTWLDHDNQFRSLKDENEWKAFVQVCISQLGFNPEKEGILAGAEKLANHEGPWLPVWVRYCEAPKRYPQIPATIRRCRAPIGTLLWHTEGSALDGWPQWNEEQEANLRRDLVVLKDLPAHEARIKIKELESKHGHRREFVWSELGESPLASVLFHLSILAEITSHPLTAGTCEEIQAAYLTSGWKADDAASQIIAELKKPDDVEIAISIIRTIYLPWVEDAARYLQSIIQKVGYPSSIKKESISSQYQNGDCILFVDGLRCDCAHRLIEKITAKGYQTHETPFWVPLPTVTPTGKPAVSPIHHLITGSDDCTNFIPNIAETNKPIKTPDILRSHIEKSGWQYIDRTSTGDPQGKGWSECGDLDSEGHSRGQKLPGHLDIIISEITERISELLQAGWKRVHVVTDHGWLLMPGGLPKVELYSGLAETQWKRCASLKEGASTQERQFPWFWNPHVHYVIADGIGCFKMNETYTHGGLSLQECLTLKICVSAPAQKTSSKIDITDWKWRGLRCTVALDNPIPGTILDIRTNPGDPQSSLVLTKKPVDEFGKSSVIVEDEGLQNSKAMIVILDEKGGIMAQKDTIIGEQS